jgi:hypothetical protein
VCPAGKAGSYTVPNSVTDIAMFAFKTCRSLTNITIPESVTSIGGYAFTECTSLTAITVGALNPVYSSVAGVLFNRGQTILIACPGGKSGTYMVPNSVTKIGDGAFVSCTSLTDLTIPNSVTEIGNWTFHNCSGLTGIGIPSSVTNIGGYAFEYCYGLTNVAMPSSITSIPPYAFQHCTRLTSITIPSSVTHIETYAFLSCTSLKEVYFAGNAPNLGSSVFNSDTNATVYYLPGTTGWGATFGGRPAALWNPLIQTSGSSFGVRTNRFGFDIAGTANIPIVVEASTNLAGSVWVPLQTGTLANGSLYFSDPQWTNHPARFYRIRSP